MPVEGVGDGILWPSETKKSVSNLSGGKVGARVEGVGLS
jgi:hypothetical protein